MARVKKTVETPGQETTHLHDAAGEDQSSGITEAPTVDTEATALAARNAILATLNAQGAAIVARFEEYAFTDSLDHPLTNNLDFLNLVRKATEVRTGGTAEQVTNEEGKKQPVRSAPVLTEHGWHVPG